MIQPFTMGHPLSACALAAASLCLVGACGGETDVAPGDRALRSPTEIGRDAGSGGVGTASPDWAPGEARGSSMIAKAPIAPTVTPAGVPWDANGRAGVTPPEEGPADRATHGSGQRYATRAQLEQERTAAAPYTVVIDADDEAAIESGLQYAQTLDMYVGGKAQLRVFVRSRHPALASRLAERLTHEQGWVNVFVVH